MCFLDFDKVMRLDAGGERTLVAKTEHPAGERLIAEERKECDEQPWWRGELTTRRHTEAPGQILLFGGRKVTCGFTGVYSDGRAEVDGTALVGETSVFFPAKLLLQSDL
jgi:hypothetical protein